MNIDDIIESAQLKGRVIALNAQVETITAEVRCLEAVIRSHERVDCLTVVNLKAEVERLRKAGDEMAEAGSLSGCSECFGMYGRLEDAIQAWNAAKEVQS